MARLANYGTMNRDMETKRLEDIEGKEVVIQGAKTAPGKWGDYVLMEVVDPSGEVLTIITGAQFVVDAVKDALAKKELPLNAKFFRKGRTWLFE